jgi:hydrogenase maturation protease
VSGAETPSILVIGYGNTLRRDDGAGWKAAEEVARWGCPSVRVLTRALLTPDLADEIEGADLVVFIDARADRPESGVLLEPVSPPAGAQVSLLHASSPAMLLGLCRALSGRAPEAFLLSIPAEDLGFGEDLSASAERGRREALSMLRERFRRMGQPEPGRTELRLARDPEASPEPP